MHTAQERATYFFWKTCVPSLCSGQINSPSYLGVLHDLSRSTSVMNHRTEQRHHISYNACDINEDRCNLILNAMSHLVCLLLPSSRSRSRHSRCFPDIISPRVTLSRRPLRMRPSSRPRSISTNAETAPLSFDQTLSFFYSSFHPTNHIYIHTALRTP